jgi:hypothetical protein
MKNLLKFSLLTLLLTAFIGCSEDDASKSSNVKLAVSTTSKSTGVTSKSAGTNDLKFTSGKIIIREVVFDGQNGSNSISRTIEQVATIDYATGVISPEVKIAVPSGTYTSVNLGIELQDINSTPSVVIEGTYTNSSAIIIPIRFEFNSGEVFEANAASVVIPEGSDVVGKITFDVLSWFSTITKSQLDDATLTNGTIVVSATSNATIFTIVADRLDVDTQAVFQ